MIKIDVIKFNREYDNPKFGSKTYYFKAILEDGREVEFSSAKKEQTKFDQGGEYEEGKDVEITEKTTKSSGKPYLFMDVIREAFTPGAPRKSSAVEKKYMMREVALEATLDTLVKTEYTLKNDFELIRDNYVDFLEAHSTTDNEGKAASNALRRSIQGIEIFGMTTLEQIIGRAEKFLAWYAS